ncbi:MAG: S9 family peptidase, partial [Planctomycetota bacterium]
MSARKTAPHGSWASPITAKALVAASVGLGEMAFDGEDLLYVENRPREGGRSVLVRYRPDGTRTDLTPAPFDVRSRVHEYGGGSFAVADGLVLFSNFADQRLYR